jgi:flagellar assembly factor FliW
MTMPKFETERFGPLVYAEHDVIRIGNGLIGMPQLQHWLMLELGDGMPLKWLQSLDRADFGFPVTAPEFFHDEYRPDVPPEARERLATTDDAELVFLVITTVQAAGTRISGNTRAPIVVDAASRRGVQLSLEDPALSVRQEIDYLKFGLAVGSETSDNDAPVAPGLSTNAGQEAETADIGV